MQNKLVTEKVFKSEMSLVNQEFRKIDQKFEQIDQKFEQIDQRFEQIDQRFEQIDQRFDKIDQRFDKVEKDIHEIRGLFEESQRENRVLAEQILDRLVPAQHQKELQRELSVANDKITINTHTISKHINNKSIHCSHN